MEWYLHSLVALSAIIDLSLTGKGNRPRITFKESSFHYEDCYLFICLFIFFSQKLSGLHSAHGIRVYSGVSLRVLVMFLSSLSDPQNTSLAA